MNGRAAVECRIDELKNELAADQFCLRSFFATESAFLAVPSQRMHQRRCFPSFYYSEGQEPRELSGSL
jgi:hypothetical protein